jgi:hypothetical protein
MVNNTPHRKELILEGLTTDLSFAACLLIYLPIIRLGYGTLPWTINIKGTPPI